MFRPSKKIFAKQLTLPAYLVLKFFNLKIISLPIMTTLGDVKEDCEARSTSVMTIPFAPAEVEVRLRLPSEAKEKAAVGRQYCYTSPHVTYLPKFLPVLYF